jgi:hypothetical protein
VLGRLVVVGSPTVRFAECGRLIATAARRQGVRPPSFRSPPRLRDRDRTLRRRPDGSVVVAVRLAGRPFVAVAADMVEGTVAASGRTGPDADELRRVLWAALAPSGPDLRVIDAA